MEQLKTIGRELAMGSQGGFDQSKEFLDLIKSIGEARSKAEENRIVLRYSQEEDERMWPSLIAKAKSGGIDLIDTYMFGNIHEPQQKARYAQKIVKLMKSKNLYASQGGVPWVMCKQDDAPDPLVNACNGRQCGETFKGPNSPNKPAVWTEN